ncbi:MAG: sigma-70 family RNA polymerase sigma factor [Negativicoccus massiliensis]|uniref:sigma-70 family RNA polymerase sigma factor n=1 Tax=Negativicoccus succinicivorans TaxID=620903 RepID=UPI0026EAE8CB|nr:sigma-70 family RNA polymerase sigma factor [Negativicoccus succinicivorans]MBS5887433.1 sigma-70 family RNA polymerase sigma factor [Negativicoccus succinicivorans]MDU1056090.1 sigma-70 family RNA polymerase sigma factor [Negativicoccus succinicivorans]MDU4641508.1 sigma-70 family RNA polymerase sigma factor [Negativicoccus massiliensis]MDU5027396.1 sigma-70 family RNA polymerase sigma factor [Negativicoccus succinicivorans]
MLKEYFQELAKIELLDPETEASLWRAYKEKQDRGARQTLIEHYQPLVVKEAMRWQLQEATLLDLLQEGTVGLMEAAERYEPARSVAFSLFARHRIRGRMLDYIYKNGTDIPVEDSAWAESRAQFNSLVTEATDAFEAADRTFLWEAVRNAVHRLPPKEQQVVDGIYIQNREPKELALELQVSKTYIYKLQKTGIRRLRGMLSRLMHERRE